MSLFACKPDRELPAAGGLPLEVQVVISPKGVDPTATALLTNTLGAQLPWLAPAPGSAWFDLAFHQPKAFLSDPKLYTASLCLVVLAPTSPSDDDAALWRALQYRLQAPQEKLLRDSGVVWVKNIWAKDQMVLFFKPPTAHFATTWRRHWPAIVQLFQQHTANQLRRQLLEDDRLTPASLPLRQSWNLDLPLPADFNLLQANDSCWWFERALPPAGKCWLLLYRPQNPRNAARLAAPNLPTHLGALIQALPAPGGSWLSSAQSLAFPQQQQFFFPQGWLGSPGQTHPLYCGQWRASSGPNSASQRQGSYVAILPANPSELWVGFVEGPANLQREWLLHLQALLQPRPFATQP